MKRTGKIMIALLLVGAMLLSFAACGKKADIMSGIFEKLQTNTDYAQWKADFNATTFEEALDGNTITIKATGEEGLNGEFVFTLDGDYIVATADEGDYSTYSVMMYIKGALADYYGMNNTLMTGYLAGLGYAEKENTFFIVESAEGKTTYKLYAASAWDMEGLDEMIVDEQALAYTEPLTEESRNNIINCGKLSVYSIGSKDDLALAIGEYGENTDLTLKSLQNVVAALQPNGYEAFAADYTELKEAAGSGYTVSLGLSDDFKQRSDYAGVDGYSYVTVIFSADAGEADGQNPVMNFIGDYQADRCSIHIEADGATDAKISVDWANSASENVHWTMSGLFDPDTMRINYSNSTKTVTTYDSNGDVVEEKEEYTGGSGRIQFYDDGTLAWQDEQEAENLAGMTFEFIAPISEEPETTQAATSAAATTEAANDGQNPVMNYIGEYSAGRCTITIEADGATDAKISVHWGSSATESSNWTMSGTFDPDTLRINYSDAVKTNIVFDENGNDTATVEYKDGFGRIQFYDDGTLAWQDEKEAENLVGMVFTSNN